MSPSLLAVAGLSLLLGFRHAFEPDHLAAVSTLATRQGSVLRASWLGIVWGLGHTASVALVALLVIGAGLSLPPRLWPAADFLVGVLLVALGAAVLWRYARGRWHMHTHSHDGAPHLHLRSHAPPQGADHSHRHTRWDLRRSLGFGLLHGLAGSGAIVVLLIATVPTRGAQLAYLGVRPRHHRGDAGGVVVARGGRAARVAPRRALGHGAASGVGRGECQRRDRAGLENRRRPLAGPG